MSGRTLLIRCAAPRPERQDELERWLAGRVRALPEADALLYRAPPQAGAPANDAAEAWVIELGAPEATAEPHTVSVLLGEMRMLGLDPAVFRGGGE